MKNFILVIVLWCCWFSTSAQSLKDFTIGEKLIGSSYVQTTVAGVTGTIIVETHKDNTIGKIQFLATDMLIVDIDNFAKLINKHYNTDIPVILNDNTKGRQIFSSDDGKYTIIAAWTKRHKKISYYTLLLEILGGTPKKSTISTKPEDDF